ncbi:MAG: hypothetical protein HY083_10990 [Gammaproteobacteria bacterium]|nr:hypothetical protein [Gammaproteobacteria bacterium]
MADDALRLVYEHLEGNKEKAENGVDLFIHSNGGSGTVPWRLVSLIREYAKHLAVLVPNRAFSAATLVALGADEIVMHRMGCLGPIDPSVSNIFNPPNPQNPGQRAPISVEDVTAYFKMVKDEVGITHEDELVQALIALTSQIHPLALGNVQRSHSQARMMARKLLKLHMPKKQEHEIEQIIDNLKSNLFFHGHPINRDEAKKDLELKVVVADDALESAMWNLYLQYEQELKLTESFNPLHEIEIDRLQNPAAAGAVTTEDIIKQMGQLAQQGIQIGAQGLTEEQIVRLAVAMLPAVQGKATDGRNRVKLEKIPGVYVESIARTDVFCTDLALEAATINTPSGPQDVVKQEVLWQRWERET